MAEQSTLYIHATIITVDPEQTTWLDGAVLVKGQRIVAIEKSATLLQEHRTAIVVDCKGQIMIPGLINTHAHLGQSLLRGLAEDKALHNWLCDAIWPLEARYEGNDGYVAARLTIAEMLKSGTTCFLEAMLTPTTGFDNAARAVQELGIRACLGKLVKAQESTMLNRLADPRDRDLSSMSIDAALEAHRQHHNSCDDRLQVWMAAVTPRGSSETAHKVIGDTCAERGIGITMHCAEAPKDLEIFRQSYGCTPIQFCHRANLIGKGRHTVLAHMVNLELDKDLPLLQEHGASVAYNASSNCKLGSGVASVPDMIAKGINVGLGTDGAPCANTYDMVQEMRLASLLQKGARQDATIMTAEQVLRMATINGAKALGLEHDIGSLEVGKKADFVLIDATALSCAPYDVDQVESGGVDPVTAVVFSCSGDDVRKVVVDGQLLVDEKRLLRCDEEQIKQQARQAIARIRKSSGIDLPRRAYR